MALLVAVILLAAVALLVAFDDFNFARFTCGRTNSCFGMIRFRFVWTLSSNYFVDFISKVMIVLPANFLQAPQFRFRILLTPNFAAPLVF